MPGKKIYPTLNLETFSQYNNFKLKLQTRFGGRISHQQIIQELLNIEKENEELRKEKKENDQYIKNLLNKSMNQPIYIHSPNQSSSKNFDQIELPRPPAPPKSLNSDYELDPEIKKELALEFKTTFTGEFRKPSEIAKLCKTDNLDKKEKNENEILNLVILNDQKIKTNELKI